MEFIGHKSSAIFDLWSVAHFLLGMALGRLPERIFSRYNLAPTTRSNAMRTNASAQQYLLVLVFAASWEVVEFALEAGIAGPTIGFWFQGHEHMLNRALSDPLLVLAGFWLANTHARWMTWPSRVALLVWGWIFMVVLPHSMAYSG